jgi:serpin B
MPDEAALMTAARESAVTANAFGADLYQRLAQDGADMVFSPVSVASALWLAWCGARGQTAAELARALHLTGCARCRLSSVTRRPGP